MKLLEEITPCLNNSYILIPNTTSAPIIASNCNPGSYRWQSNHLCPNCLGLRAVLPQDTCLSPLLHWIPGPLPSLCVSTAHTSDCSSSGVLQPAFWIVLCLPLTDLRHLCNSTTILIQKTLPARWLNFNFSPGLSIHVSNHQLHLPKDLCTDAHIQKPKTELLIFLLDLALSFLFPTPLLKISSS